MIADISSNSEITPTFVGMVVLVLISLAQFFFAWRKDMRANDSVRKADLDSLRDDVMGEIDNVADDLKSFKNSIERRQEDARKESNAEREKIHNRITESALKLSALVAGQETMTQTMIALTNKVDRALMKSPGQ